MKSKSQHAVCLKRLDQSQFKVVGVWSGDSMADLVKNRAKKFGVPVYKDQNAAISLYKKYK